MIYHYITEGRGNSNFIKYSDNIMIYHYGMGHTREKFSSLPAKKTQKFETATRKENFLTEQRVALDNCQYQISNLYLLGNVIRSIAGLTAVDAIEILGPQLD